MDTRSRQPAGWGNHHDLSKELQRAIEAVRSMPSSAQTEKRILDCVRVVRSRSPWLSFLLRGIASRN